MVQWRFDVWVICTSMKARHRFATDDAGPQHSTIDLHSTLGKGGDKGVINYLNYLAAYS